MSNKAFPENDRIMMVDKFNISGVLTSFSDCRPTLFGMRYRIGRLTDPQHMRVLFTKQVLTVGDDTIRSGEPGDLVIASQL